MGTFGYEIVGANGFGPNTWMICTKYHCPEVCTGIEIHLFAENWDVEEAGNMSVAIYDGLNRLVEKTVSIPALYVDWIVCDIADTALLHQDYWLGFKSMQPHNNMGGRWNAGAAGQTEYNTGLAVGDVCPNPRVVSGNGDRQFSIHCDYTVGAAKPLVTCVRFH